MIIWNYSTSPTGSENHLSPLRFQTFNRKVFWNRNEAKWFLDPVGEVLELREISITDYLEGKSGKLLNKIPRNKPWLWNSLISTRFCYFQYSTLLSDSSQALKAFNASSLRSCRNSMLRSREEGVRFLHRLESHQSRHFWRQMWYWQKQLCRSWPSRSWIPLF